MLKRPVDLTGQHSECDACGEHKQCMRRRCEKNSENHTWQEFHSEGLTIWPGRLADQRQRNQIRIGLAVGSTGDVWSEYWR